MFFKQAILITLLSLGFQYTNYSFAQEDNTENVSKEEPFVLIQDIPQTASKVAPDSSCIKTTVRTCPTGSISITTNLPGETNNTKCKKLAGELNGSTLPINGSTIGSWGVVSGNQIWRYVDSIITIKDSCTTPIE